MGAPVKIRPEGGETVKDTEGTNCDRAEKDYIDGMSIREIAGKYGVSENTVKSWKRRKKWMRPQKKRGASKTGKKVHPPKKRKRVQPIRSQKTSME